MPDACPCFGYGPPSGAHAASGMHGAGHDQISAAKQGAEHAHHTHGAMMSYADESATEGQSAEDDDVSAHCCNGICMSLALLETSASFVVAGPHSTYAAYYNPSHAIEPAAFLRPPKHLI